MTNKCDLIKCSIANFTKFGSKRYTLDELANTMGISKKTIYKYFRSKEHLVIESVAFLIDEFRKDLNNIVQTHTEDPITCIILIYKKGFENLKHFKPSFIFGLKKYYPKANEIFDDFRDEIVNKVIYGLLEDGKIKGIVKPEVNTELFCSLYFKRFEEVAFRDNNLIEKFNNEELLNHFVVYNLKGITVNDYNNAYFG